LFATLGVDWFVLNHGGAEAWQRPSRLHVRGGEYTFLGGYTTHSESLWHCSHCNSINNPSSCTITHTQTLKGIADDGGILVMPSTAVYGL
jgi:hypothetical protein